MFTLNRNHIFLIGLITALLFALIHILNFTVKSEITKGKVVAWYGPDPVVYFYDEGKMVQFTGESYMNVEVGDIVNVIYEEENPRNAAVFSFTGFFMRYFMFLILPMILFTAFVYSYFSRYDIITVNFKKDAGQRISKNKRLN